MPDDPMQYTRNEVILFAAECVYRALNPESTMETPNVVYEAIEKKLNQFDESDDAISWRADKEEK